MRERRPVLDDEHALALERRAVLERDRGLRPDHRRAAVHRGDVREHAVDLLGRRRVDLVDDDDVRQPQVRLARVVGQLVAGPRRVEHRDPEVGLEEREVVVPAVPDHDVGLLLGAREDLAVVHARPHDHAHLHGGLVLLALFDGGMRRVDVGERGEALHAHPLEVAVRHRVPHERDPKTCVHEQLADPAARLALAAPRAHRGDGDDGPVGHQHRRARPEQVEVGSRCEHERRLVHDLLVREVGVGEDDLVHELAPDQLGEITLVVDRDAFGVEGAGERRRVDPVRDAGDLGGRERHDPGVAVAPEDDVEVVEVAPARAHDHDTAHGSSFLRHGCQELGRRLVAGIGRPFGSVTSIADHVGRRDIGARADPVRGKQARRVWRTTDL